MRRSTRYAALATVVAAVLAATALPATADVNPAPYVTASVGEPPTAVAVADTGVIAAGLFDAQAVALIEPTGDVRLVQLDCSPYDVAIDPSGATAWAVCQGSEHLNVIDVASAQVARASMETAGLDDIVYLPEVDQLLIASIDGQIITVSEVSAGGYRITSRVVTPGWRITQLAPFADGSRTYALTDAGDLLYVDLEFSGQVRLVRANSPYRSYQAIALSPFGTTLYGAVLDFGTDPAVPRFSVDVLNPTNGLARQSVPLDMPLAGSTAVQVVAGNRVVAVGSGLYFETESGNTGFVSLPVGEQGELGAVAALTETGSTGSAIALSANGSRMAGGTTNSTVFGLTADDQPYPAAITATAKRKGTKITVTGTTRSLPVLTRLTVYVKDLTKKKSRFVKQKKQALVSFDGSFTWQGKIIAKRVSLYVSGDGVRSKAVTVGK